VQALKPIICRHAAATVNQIAVPAACEVVAQETGRHLWDGMTHCSALVSASRMPLSWSRKRCAASAVTRISHTPLHTIAFRGNDRGFTGRPRGLQEGRMSSVRHALANEQPWQS
jgi:hypothetical protein